MQNEMPDDEADLPADEALSELDAAPLEPPDEYAGLYEFAGCYPWLDGIVQAHPHDAMLLAALRGEAAEPDVSEPPVYPF